MASQSTKNINDRVCDICTPCTHTHSQLNRVDLSCPVAQFIHPDKCKRTYLLQHRARWPLCTYINTHTNTHACTCGWCAPSSFHFTISALMELIVDLELLARNMCANSYMPDHRANHTRIMCVCVCAVRRPKERARQNTPAYKCMQMRIYLACYHIKIFIYFGLFCLAQKALGAWPGRICACLCVFNTVQTPPHQMSTAAVRRSQIASIASGGFVRHNIEHTYMHTTNKRPFLQNVKAPVSTSHHDDDDDLFMYAIVDWVVFNLSGGFHASSPEPTSV